MTGPFEAEREARAAAGHAGLTGPVATRNRDMLTRACWGARVEVGAFDARILSWLAGYEPSTCAVVAGLITRAYDAGRASAGRVATEDGEADAAGYDPGPDEEPW